MDTLESACTVFTQQNKVNHMSSFAKGRNTWAWIPCRTFATKEGARDDHWEVVGKQSQMAANAWLLAWTCRTLFSWSWTAELSPPEPGWPHARTLSPPQHHNAKVVWVAASFASTTTAVSWSPSWSPAASRDSDGFSLRPAEVTSLRKSVPKDSWTIIFKSPTVEARWIERLALRPLGRDAVTWSICSTLETSKGWSICSRSPCSMLQSLAKLESK